MPCAQKISIVQFCLMVDRGKSLTFSIFWRVMFGSIVAQAMHDLRLFVC